MIKMKIKLEHDKVTSGGHTRLSAGDPSIHLFLYFLPLRSGLRDLLESITADRDEASSRLGLVETHNRKLSRTISDN